MDQLGQQEPTNKRTKVANIENHMENHVWINDMRFPKYVSNVSNILGPMLHDQSEEEEVRIEFPTMDATSLQLFHTFVTKGSTKIPGPVFLTNPILDRALTLSHFLDAPTFKECLFKILKQKGMPKVNSKTYVEFLDRTNMVPLGLEVHGVNELVFAESNYHAFECKDLFNDYMDYWTKNYYQDPDTKEILPLTLTYNATANDIHIYSHQPVIRYDRIGRNFMTYDVEKRDNDLFLILKEHATNRYYSEHKLLFKPHSFRFSNDGTYLIAKYHDLYVILETRTGKVIRQPCATSRPGWFLNNGPWMVESTLFTTTIQSIDPAIPDTVTLPIAISYGEGNLINVFFINNMFVLMYRCYLDRIRVVFMDQTFTISFRSAMIHIGRPEFTTSIAKPDSMLIESDIKRLELAFPFNGVHNMKELSKEECQAFKDSDRIDLFRRE